MSSRTLEQWIALYNKKIPEGFKRDERFALFYSPEEGFAEFEDSGTAIFANQCCGDFKFWFDFGMRLARDLGRKFCVASLCRAIRPYLRLGGYNIEREVETPLGTQFFCRHKGTGLQGIAFPTPYQSQSQIYYFVAEVDADGLLF